MPKKSNQKRSDGRIAVQVYLGRVDGVRKYKTVYGKTQKEVDQKARELKNQINKGIDLTSKDTTFSDWVSQWLKVKKKQVSPSQYKLYENRINYFSDRVGHRPVIKIKLYELQDIMDELAEHNPYTNKETSKRTLLYYSTTVKQFFQYLLDNRVIEYNPTTSLHISTSAPSEKRRALTSEEQQWVRTFKHRAQVPAMIAMLAGLRRGEITALLWSDIDFNNKTISVTKSFDFKNNQVKDPKTKAGVRTVSMPSELCEFLNSQPKTSLLVCPNTEGRLMTEPAWQRLWSYYMNALNREFGDLTFWKLKKKKSDKKPPMVIQPFTMHCLRHTYATILYDAGVDVLTAKKLLGHEDIKTTLGIYTHLSAENEKLNIDKLNTFLNDKKQDASQNASQNA